MLAQTSDDATLQSPPSLGDPRFRALLTAAD